MRNLQYHVKQDKFHHSPFLVLAAWMWLLGTGPTWLQLESLAQPDVLESLCQPDVLESLAQPDMLESLAQPDMLESLAQPAGSEHSSCEHVHIGWVIQLLLGGEHL